MTVNQIDPTKVRLSDSPLDDYQRLYFLNLFSDIDNKNHNNNGQPSLYINVKNVIFKTSYNEIFNDLRKFITINNKNKSIVKQNVAIELNGEKNNLNCLEYQVPNILIHSDESQHTVYDISEQYWKRLASTEKNIFQFLKGELNLDNNLIISDYENGKIKFSNDNFTLPTSCRKRQNSVVGKVKVVEKNDSNSMKIMFSQNQQDIILLNPNNYIIWTEKHQHVFFSGIWRLYQDVIRALSNSPRYTVKSLKNNNDDVNQSNLVLQKICESEFRFTMNYAFSGIDIGADIKKIRMRRSRKHNCSHPNKSSSVNNFSVVANAKYIDFPWSYVDASLEKRLLDEYKQYLKTTQSLTEEEIDYLQFKDLIQKIRGGYTKIQGCWLPYTIAREFCLRFCYPIRYLLIPVFGESFPDECSEKYFLMKLKATGINGPVIHTSKIKHNERNRKISSKDTRTTRTQEKATKQPKKSGSKRVRKPRNSAEPSNKKQKKPSENKMKHESSITTKTQNLVLPNQDKTPVTTAVVNSSCNVNQVPPRKRSSAQMEIENLIDPLTTINIAPISNIQTPNTAFNDRIMQLQDLRSAATQNIHRESILPDLNYNRSSSWSISSSSTFMTFDKNSEDILPPLSSILSIPTTIKNPICYRKNSNESVNASYILEPPSNVSNYSYRNPRPIYYPLTHRDMNRNNSIYSLTSSAMGFRDTQNSFRKEDYEKNPVILKRASVEKAFQII
ncbi:hypothetical protein TPHA_0D01580 [Tetrapisispora phaffii CBS 4417]|uniref:HTH APSES-type domain-containing protein n=1 Tax=Tetrapisispora phaffii (strain ATCC 24235 / CBS 4417 / NBRC 1672 / NRRL Y-8282 / UCD 70-5) TaxID=1071381 RepID=G8BSH7_TETPH|nr:hypothetical protein TPHA_0D01580 [Tetrapisispora phaffii CBS 4417]CCE62798.1 hypothetical protein TPHA_0D01580 [Tetrapisispora phaffii CBS 4417]